MAPQFGYRHFRPSFNRVIDALARRQSEKRGGPFRSVRASTNGTTLHSEIESTARSGLRAFQLVDDTIGVDKIEQIAVWVTACGHVSMLAGGPGSPDGEIHNTAADNSAPATNGST